MSVDYVELNQQALAAMLSVKEHISSIDKQLQAPVEIRVSQINGCAYCVDMHSNQARQLGVAQQLLDCLPVWRESQLFSDSQAAALHWAEAVTLIANEKDMEAQLGQLLDQFSQAEAVDLTITISLMNSLNRMALSFGDRPARRD
jgi:AhpD family alkylhydroperoxidase